MDAQKKPIKIIIIDSGIDTAVSDLARYVKKSTGIRINDAGYIIEDGTMKPAHEHGTVIALTIRHICENVEIVSINILNEKLSADGRVLICAFQQAISYKPDIIHMSLGTTKWNYKHPLRKLVKKASKLSTVIVSAANNFPVKSYPAYIKGVVGVKGCKTSDYMNVEYKNDFFYAPFDVKNIRGINELSTAKYFTGSSVAAGYITGHIASLKYSKNILSNLEIIEFLKTLDKKRKVTDYECKK